MGLPSPRLFRAECFGSDSLHRRIARSRADPLPWGEGRADPLWALGPCLASTLPPTFGAVVGAGPFTVCSCLASAHPTIFRAEQKSVAPAPCQVVFRSTLKVDVMCSKITT